MKKKKNKSSTISPLVRWWNLVAPEILARHMISSRCVNATRVCVEVLSAFGMRDLLPVSVRVAAMNPKYAGLAQEHGWPDEEKLKTWVADGAWAVGVDEDASHLDVADNTWPGHLVLLVQGKTLVDSALGQFSRPEKDLPLPEVFAGALDLRHWLQTGSAAYELDGGALVFYQLRAEDHSFAGLPGFQPHEENLWVAGLIYDRMAEGMGSRTRWRDLTRLKLADQKELT